MAIRLIKSEITNLGLRKVADLGAGNGEFLR
jgi:predicted RNA methylase